MYFSLLIAGDMIPLIWLKVSGWSHFRPASGGYDQDRVQIGSSYSRSSAISRYTILEVSVHLSKIRMR